MLFYYYLSLLLNNLAIFILLNFICIFLVSVKLGFQKLIFVRMSGTDYMQENECL
jgi:hypothetical protein